MVYCASNGEIKLGERPILGVTLFEEAFHGKEWIWYGDDASILEKSGILWALSGEPSELGEV